jgi:ribosomal protein S18 acetylase RimI-like enzyme
LWNLFREVIESGDSYTQDEGITRESFVDYWLGRGGEQWVALDSAGAVVGGYTLRANQPGRGAHVGTASYIVARAARGRQIGRALGEHSIERARVLGFLALQFNCVVSTNTAAVQLWQVLGFAIVGTLPRVFRHREHGLVDAYVMHRFRDSTVSD